MNLQLFCQYLLLFCKHVVEGRSAEIVSLSAFLPTKSILRRRKELFWVKPFFDSSKIIHCQYGWKKTVFICFRIVWRFRLSSGGDFHDEKLVHNRMTWKCPHQFD